MTRDDLKAALLAFVRAGYLALADARALVAAYDAGADGLTVAPPLSGPALAALFTAALRAGYRRLALAIARAYPRAVPANVAALAGRGDGAAVRAALSVADRLPLPERIKLIDAVRADDLRGALSREVERATRVLNSSADVATFGPGVEGSARRSAGDVARWQRRMRAAFAEDSAALARLGAGGDLSPAQARRLASVLRDKAAYVDGLASRLATDGAGLTKPLTEAQVRAYVVRASGDARALFFENAVGAESAGIESPVVHYRALDDPATCGPCAEAERAGPYLVGSGHPVPGSVCRGGGHCRCELEIEDDPAEYARLTSAAVAA